MSDISVKMNTLIPPEFVALIPSQPQEYAHSPTIIGYTFCIEDKLYYRVGGGVTMNRSHAEVYDARTVELVSVAGGWGHKRCGKWQAVYEEKSV